MVAVQVENVTFSYNRRVTNLENVNLLVPRGTIYGLLGPSGCSKTTLLRCIVGRLKPRAGTITVFGYQPGTKQCGIPGPNIGYMPQDLSLISQFTVRETLEYYAGFAKQNNMPNNSLNERIEFLLKLLDIGDFENCYTDRLSGGQKRRVSLAVAMINDPPLLILDEPTVGVDPIVRDAIWSYLVNQSKNGLTVIVTTHYIEEAGSADNVGFMRQGRILAEGNPTLLMHQHCVLSMEQLFLKLSQRDDLRVRTDAEDYTRDILMQLSSTTTTTTTTANNETGGVEEVEVPTFNGAASYSNGSVNFVNNRRHPNHHQHKTHSLVVISNEISYNPIDDERLVKSSGKLDTLATTTTTTANNNNNSFNYNNNNYSANIAASEPPPLPSNQLKSNNLTSTKIESNYTTVLIHNNNNSLSRSKAGRTYSVHGQDRTVRPYQRVGVLCRKHRIRLFRRVSELVITMLLPALEVALFCLCMGRDPSAVQMAVCNQERPPLLSKLFLHSIDSDFIALKYYDTPQQAINSVRDAETYSAIILAKNFSNLLKHFGSSGGGGGGGSITQRIQTITMASPLEQPAATAFTSGDVLSLQTPNTESTNRTSSTASMVKRSIEVRPTSTTPNTPTTDPYNYEPSQSNLVVDEEDDSVIKIYYDGSNALHVNIIRREVFGALFRFVEMAGKALGSEIPGYKLPIKFEKPIYGSEKTDMIEFVGPGLMVFIVFFATMSITSMAFLSERREGTLERSLIVGMTPTEFLLSQIINITFLLVVQIILTVVMGFWIFDFPMKGSYVLAVTMMFLQGLCGMTYGLMLSSICTSEMTALMLGAGSQLMFCFITGIFWPVDTMIPLLRYISYAMPQTKPMESFRHILIRGFDLSKPAVYNGYIITVAWIIFFLILAIAIFRFR